LKLKIIRKKDDAVTTSLRDATQTLQATGRRLTSQRRLLLKVLTDSHAHLDAEEIYALAKEQEPNISLATVYRTLGELVEAGMLHKMTLGGRSVYEHEYGYPSHELYQSYRGRGTLMAYRVHETSEDLYQNPGEQDLTSHVNFSALKYWGEKEGLKTLGFTDQSNFLLGIGLLDMISGADGESPPMDEVLKAKTLIMPGGMGDTFKVLIQAKGVNFSWVPSGLKEVPRRQSFEL
jgi:Fe2+ or Zn2+ uptake regulation protein